jgi:hypothetical protein
MFFIAKITLFFHAVASLPIFIAILLAQKKPVTSRCPIFKTNYLKTNLLKQIKNIITILVYYFGCKYKH